MDGFGTDVFYGCRHYNKRLLGTLATGTADARLPVVAHLVTVGWGSVGLDLMVQ